MSRRDTIIIAILVNAGLLLVLFATAFKTEKKEVQSHPIVKSQSESLPKSHTLSDDVESVLNQFASTPTLNKGADDFLLTQELTIPLPQTENIFLTPVPTSVTSSQKVESHALKESLLNAGEETVIVTVKKGDVLEKIAKSYHTSVAAIMKVNQLSSTQLKIGQVLKVPTKEGVKLVAPPSQIEKASLAEYYTVKEGDSPWLIATKNHVKLEELLKLNGLDEQKARKLRPGDRLRIR
jgi:peptidoglycan endopeptidase LytF